MMGVLFKFIKGKELQTVPCRLVSVPFRFTTSMYDYILYYFVAELTEIRRI
jgi:hypothetical protein